MLSGLKAFVGRSEALGPCQRMVSSTLHGDRAWTEPEMTFCFGRWVCQGEMR